MKRDDNFIDIKTVVCTEPRIELLKKQIESLLSIVELEYRGKVVTPGSFRLKNLDHWKVPKDDNPEEIVRYFGCMKPCPSNCVFCYRKGYPPGLVYNSTYYASAAEIETRIRYYLSEEPYMLYRACFDCDEVLSASGVFKCLDKIRNKTKAPLSISTGGRMLNPAVIDRLKAFKPLILSISLHSANEKIRQSLMGDVRAGIGIKALPYLKEAEISFSIAIVAWFDIPLSDLEETIRHAAQFNPVCINLNLPGYTRYGPSPGESAGFPWWEKVVSLAQDLRREIDCPLITVPALFEANQMGLSWKAARVVGVVKHSPAYEAGLKYGDEIVAVGGCAIRSRPHLNSILGYAERNNIAPTLTISRDGREETCLLKPRENNVSYVPGFHSFGLMIPSGLSHRDVDKVCQAIDHHNAHTPLILTTNLMRASLEKAMAEYTRGKDGCNVLFCELQSGFYGGNIILGDLMPVDDYVLTIHSFVKEKAIKPDLLVVPASGFGEWRRDLTGKSALIIERAFDIPVQMIDNNQIFY